MNKGYATDATDEQWALIEPLIPPAKHGGAPRTINMRLVFNTILYVNKTGCQWALIPNDLAKRSSAFDYFSAWKKTAPGKTSWTPCGGRFALQQAMSRNRKRQPSIRRPSKARKQAVREAMTAARRSTVANAILSWTPWACYWSCWSPPPTLTMVPELRKFSNC